MANARGGQANTVTLATELDRRKRQFRAALALSRMTAKQFAVRHRWTDAHLSLVLSGKRTSEPVLRAVTRFIRSAARKHGELLVANADEAA